MLLQLSKLLTQSRKESIIETLCGDRGPYRLVDIRQYELNHELICQGFRPKKVARIMVRVGDGHIERSLWLHFFEAIDEAEKVNWLTEGF